ncbi:PREDICTED: ran-specific GTPase-activating protein-like [Bison bison bison]|uniref:Ran-specific GTPase-activating protein n=1 Tax=Bison bison bison TaxID=43346 RepID=A0A6P3GR48_BISBB|nr:PREDICTED: ran-specific GTPase-activating protein-like [Bison bison bison]
MVAERRVNLLRREAAGGPKEVALRSYHLCAVRGTQGLEESIAKAGNCDSVSPTRNVTGLSRINHYITPMMELKPNAGSDRAWVWNTHADFADECPKQELLAIRFLNAENAQKFKTKFEECRKEIEEKEKKGPGKNDSTEKVVEKLEALSVQEGEQPQDAAEN